MEQVVEKKAAERGLIQRQIEDLGAKQGSFIEIERAKKKTADPRTLETEIEKIIREQLKRFNMRVG